MNNKALSLIVEANDFTEYKTVWEEQNSSAEKRLYIHGPMMQYGTKNKNGRVYLQDEMIAEVGRYIEDKVDKMMAYGELNHPSSPDVDLERACHRITDLKQDGNIFVGKALVSSSPMGKIVECHIKDGGVVGMSTRCLGQLESRGDVNEVHDMRLVAVDCVHDPSCSEAFVNGIFEARQFILADDGKYEEIYEKLENSLKTLPRHDVDMYVTQQITMFINKLKSI